MRKQKVASIIVLTTLLIVICFNRIQDILVPQNYIDSTDAVDGFYALEKDSLDVLIIGSSNAFCTINPVVLYENYGIAAYDFCTSAQPISITPLYLDEALKYQKPKVVCLEVYMVADYDNTESNEDVRRWGYNDIKFSINKVGKMQKVVERNGDNLLSYAFPIIKYKERWKSLTKTDFIEGNTYTKGYNSSSGIYPENLDFSGYYEIAEEYVIDPVEFGYLDDIREKCLQEGIELVLFKSPRVDWDMARSNAIRAYADLYDLPFIDYMEKKDSIGIIAEKDYRDPFHLNDSGAWKVTMDFGEFLIKNYDLKDRRDGSAESWDYDLKVLKHMQLNNQLISCYNLDEYVQLLSISEDMIVMLNIKEKIDVSFFEQLIDESWNEAYNHCIISDKVYTYEDNKGYLYVEEGDVEFVIENEDGIYNYYLNRDKLESGNCDVEIVVYDKILKEKVDFAQFRWNGTAFKRIQK